MCGMDAQSAPRIGKKIKRAREKRRWSQQEAADRLGVSRSALNAWENDRAYPRSSIGAIEELYDIVIDGEPEREEEMPAPAELEDLRAHIREVLGEKEAAALEAALDAALYGGQQTTSGRNAGAAGVLSPRRPLRPSG